ncbi:DUF167 domain-containing protein [Candidatus Woesearchaeota archaeon]|nr:MAG: DUF167 domain-containing protein [Candidatus Woesearchaeota archaeon]
MRLNIVVKTNAKKTRIVEDNGIIKVEVKAPPENNKANMEIIKLFSKKYKTKARIVQGATSKKKVIEV